MKLAHLLAAGVPALAVAFATLGERALRQVESRLEAARTVETEAVADAAVHQVVRALEAWWDRHRGPLEPPRLPGDPRLGEPGLDEASGAITVELVRDAADRQREAHGTLRDLVDTARLLPPGRPPQGEVRALLLSPGGVLLARDSDGFPALAPAGWGAPDPAGAETVVPDPWGGAPLLATVRSCPANGPLRGWSVVVARDRAQAMRVAGMLRGVGTTLLGSLAGLLVLGLVVVSSLSGIGRG